MESGLQGTHSGPDSSSVACTGSLYSLVPRSKDPVLGELTDCWVETDKDADLNMPGIVDILGCPWGKTELWQPQFSRLETAVPPPAGSLRRLTAEYGQQL